MIRHTAVSLLTSSIKHWSVKNGDSETYIKHLLLHNFGFQPFSLTYLYSMVQNLKSTCISKNTLLQVVFSTLFSVIDLWSNTVSHVWYITLNTFFSKMFSRDILMIRTTFWLKNSGTYWKRNSPLKSAYSVTRSYKTTDHQKMLRIMPRCSWVEDVYLSLVGGRFFFAVIVFSPAALFIVNTLCSPMGNVPYDLGKMGLSTISSATSILIFASSSLVLHRIFLELRHLSTKIIINRREIMSRNFI